jgi:hypothetical protein
MIEGSKDFLENELNASLDIFIYYAFIPGHDPRYIPGYDNNHL